MGSLLSKLLASFEGTRDPWPLAVFRVAFFGGLALHFFPSLIVLDDGYRRGAMRTEEWNHWLYIHFTKLGHGTLQAMAMLTMLAVVCGIVGLRPRIAAIVGGLGLYAFASFNGLHVHTLALLNTWAILLLWMICGGGSAVLSVDAWLAKKNKTTEEAPREDALLPMLILYQTLLSVFFSGVEKLLAGWPMRNEMGILLSYPSGFLVRDWVTSIGWLHGRTTTTIFTWFTVFCEIGTPILVLPKKTRLAALVVYEIFFFGIVTMLEVPPLFWCMFAFGALLVLDDEDLARVASRLRRKRAPTPIDSQ